MSIFEPGSFSKYYSNSILNFQFGKYISNLLATTFFRLTSFIISVSLLSTVVCGIFFVFHFIDLLIYAMVK